MPLQALCGRNGSPWGESENAVPALELLKRLRSVGALPNVDDQGRRPVSNKQLERWLHNMAVEINGAMPSAFMLVELPCTSLVFFPNNTKRRITLC